MLFLVPTPIGNLEDITLRAINVLKEVDIILAEDTRNTGKLLKHLSITKRLMAHHAHNEHQSVAGVIKLLKEGQKIALVSDAGSPGISDPGYLVVKSCIENDIPITALPGATAFVPALTSSGFPTDSFVFEGFLPVKKGRQTKFKELSIEKRTIILYESPHRIVKTLEQLVEFLGEDRQVLVAREISKLHEEYHRGTSLELRDFFNLNPDKVRGEMVLIIKGIN
ncbi:MAG: rRNA ((1402)-2-O)-methyltransferase [Bacteroidota bacterium]